MKTTWTEILYRWDGEKHVLVYEQGFPDDREVAELKGEDVAKKQLDLQNKLMQQQLAQQQKQYGDIWNNFSKYMSGNIGFDPQQLALMKSQFLNQAAGGYQDAGRNLRTALLRRGAGGGDQPVGGDYTRGIAALEGGQADTVSGGLANIDLQNLQQALINKFNTGSLLSGNSAQLSQNIGTFSGGASNALGQYIQAKNSGFGSAFAQGFGGALGKTLGGGNMSFVKQF